MREEKIVINLILTVTLCLRLQLILTTRRDVYGIITQGRDDVIAERITEFDVHVSEKMSVNSSHDGYDPEWEW